MAARAEPRTGSPGWIYILRSQSYPGVVKIGRTNRDAQRRVRELAGRASYAAFGPWTEIWSRAVPDAAYAERAIHRMLARHRLRSRRSSSRELFRVDVGKARQVARAVADARQGRPAPRPARRRSSTRRDRRRSWGRLHRWAVRLSRLIELVGLTLLAVWAFGP